MSQHKTAVQFRAPGDRGGTARAAAVQFVRKVSGLQRPSRDNATAFDEAVQEITASLRKLVAGLHTQAPPRDREIGMAGTRERFARS